jgi:hypothetical protein
MGHHISTRISEHIRDTSPESAISSQLYPNNLQQPNMASTFDKVEVATNISSYQPHIIREAIEISRPAQPEP